MTSSTSWSAKAICDQDSSASPIDFDSLPAVDVDVPAFYNNEQFSQEFRLSSDYLRESREAEKPGRPAPWQQDEIAPEDLDTVADAMRKHESLDDEVECSIAEWLAARGCDMIRGPVNPSLKGEFEGFVDRYLQAMADEGMISPEDLTLFEFVDSVEEAWHIIRERLKTLD